MNNNGVNNTLVNNTNVVNNSNIPNIPVNANVTTMPNNVNTSTVPNQNVSQVSAPRLAVTEDNSVNSINNNINTSTINNNTTNMNTTTNNTINSGKEQIQAARSYKLSPEDKPQEPVKQEVKKEDNKEEIPTSIKKQKKKKNMLARFFFLVILMLGAYTAYSIYNYTNIIKQLNSSYSPVSTISEAKELDLNSTIVQDLYSKVKTNIREDIAETELNNSLKLYLAYRQIGISKFYESNCNSFNNAEMTPFTCNVSNNFVPLAFKVESLRIEYKKLFGETSTFLPENIQIGRNCIGGYQYIESRDEYVQGTCSEQITTTYKVEKTLKEATSKQSTITLKEDVKYAASEGQILPPNLKSGTYVYVFKLDNNYNYAYIAKYLEQE